MRAMARRLQADKGLGLVIVDYLQLMEPRNPADQIVRQVTEISRSLKGLARELNIPVLALSQLSRAVEQRSPQKPRLADLRESGCLTGDTLITRADTGERLCIKDLVGQTNIPVHSLDEDWKIKERKISKVFPSGKKMVYELETRSGFKIKASANHPFWKVSGWTRLEELKIGDRIATPASLHLSAPKNQLSDDEIILLAHLLGDGCILPHQPYHYTSADKKNINTVAKTAKKLFNIKPRIIRQKNWWHVYLSSPYPLARGKYHPITNWYKKLGIQRVHSWEKQIPEAVFQCNEEKIALFLKHLWSTDGDIGIRQHKKNGESINTIAGRIYYATTSQKMAEDIKHLLLRFGIRSKIFPAHKGNYRICYHINIDGTKHQLVFLNQIGCSGVKENNIPYIIQKLNNIKQNTNLDVWPKESWQLIINPIRQEKEISWREFSTGIETKYCGTTLFKHGIGIGRLNKIATFLRSPEIKNMMQSDIFWDEIASIKPLGIEEVYDATVPGTHNFVANGIIVENSLEQDADVVLFIYREDRYRPETPRKNIADIIIAKHRNGPVGSVELYFDERIVSFRNLEKGYAEE
jgi:replicative DNA helicase